jgi:hypothetical protein
MARSVHCGYRVQQRRGEPVIITPQAALNLFTPKGTLDLVSAIPRTTRESYVDLHRSVNKTPVKIGLESSIEERGGGQPRPPLRVVPMVVSDNDSAIPSIVDVLENISAQALNHESQPA